MLRELRCDEARRGRVGSAASFSNVQLTHPDIKETVLKAVLCEADNRQASNKRRKLSR